MPTVTGPILDSSGRPASGIIRVRASAAFEIGAGLVTQALGVAEVRDGQPLVANQPWTVPATPEGILLVIEQDLDGERMQTFNVFVPNVDNLTYSQLLYNRGEGAGGPQPYWWVGLSTDPIPEGAIDGDLYHFTDTGEWGKFAWS